MKIESVKSYPIRIPRDVEGSRGTAGSPTRLAGEGEYRWSEAYPVLYPVHFETALVEVSLSGGLVGWGEAQAPLAPEVACAIVDRLLKPALEGMEFDGTQGTVEELWARMYSTMRVRGQTGGFMLDAIAGVDLALWDLAGKLAGKPVSALLDASPRKSLPAYLSGVSGAGPKERGEFAARYFAQGIGLVKLYFESSWQDLLATADALPRGMEFAVDALWHMPPDQCVDMAKELDARGARWLECPLYPEEVEAHAALAESIHTPIALGESYRTVFEMQPFIDRRIVSIAQPDLGRCGITESMRIANAHGGETIPHVSIALGPQIAAALQFASAARNATMCEFNPNVLAMANRFLSEPIVMRQGEYKVPQGPGMGVTWNEEFAKLLGRV